MKVLNAVELTIARGDRRQLGQELSAQGRPDDPIPRLIVILTDVVGEVAIQLAALREMLGEVADEVMRKTRSGVQF
jgi:hypothetical protein